MEEKEKGSKKLTRQIWDVYASLQRRSPRSCHLGRHCESHSRARVDFDELRSGRRRVTRAHYRAAGRSAWSSPFLVFSLQVYGIRLRSCDPPRALSSLLCCSPTLQRSPLLTASSAYLEGQQTNQEASKGGAQRKAVRPLTSMARTGVRRCGRAQPGNPDRRVTRGGNR